MATWHHDIETYMDKVKTHLFHVLITIQPRSVEFTFSTSW